MDGTKIGLYIMVPLLICFSLIHFCGSKKLRVWTMNFRARVIFAGVLCALMFVVTICTGINFSGVMTLDQSVKEWK